MSKIVRAEVLTNSSDDKLNRVKLKSEGLWESTPLIESVNGLFLRKGEIVFVSLEDDYSSPLIIGRACNWLNAEEVVDLINSLIEKVNNNSDIFNKLSTLVNSCPVTPQDGGAAFKSALVTNLSLAANQMKSINKVTVDDLIHKD